MSTPTTTGAVPTAPAARAAGRPRLLFLRQDRTDLPAFILQHLDEHLRALQAHFDVTLVDGACDYDRVCDEHQPDLTLIESGVYARRERRIDNTHTHPDVPRLGLINADAYCQTRSVFLSDMERWGVETYFTISMVMRERMPEVADRLFVWPNFADRTLFRTYEQERSTPLLLTGSQQSNYPWRVRVTALLRERFGVEEQPHAGWFDARTAAAMVSGEAYARSLSAAQIVPTCGTIAHELVRKHLEIPAAGALLLTERTAAVEQAGFVDGVSCVLADEHDVVDKVAHLLEHPDELARIAAAGQALVHERHDLTSRDQLRQWYELTRRAQPGQRVEQPDPFGPMVLTAAGGTGGSAAAPSVPAARDLVLLARGQVELAQGRAVDAQATFGEVLALHHMPEGTRGIASALLRQGRADEAAGWAWESVEQSVRRHLAYDPDPVDWATWVRVLLCQGSVRRAAHAAGRFADVDHRELRRMRAVVAGLGGRHAVRGPARARSSVHAVPDLTWDAWLGELAGDLQACGQHALAARVLALATEGEPAPRPVAAPAAVPARRRARELPRELRRSPVRFARRRLAALRGRGGRS
ncbi:glycosyltransferase family protein [Cellulomonas soli]